MYKILIIIFIAFFLLLLFHNNSKNEYFDNNSEQYDYDIYSTPLTCKDHFQFMIDPNLPETIGCYITLDDYKKYYNPYVVDCPSIWNYNIEKDGIKYCRHDGANLPLSYQ